MGLLVTTVILAWVMIMMMTMMMKMTTKIQMMLSVKSLRRLVYRVAELKRSGRLSLTRLGLNLCLVVAECTEYMRGVDIS
jgi:hypothetical protein